MRLRADSEELSELDGVHEFNRRLGDGNDVLLARLGVDALGVDLLVIGFSFTLEGVVLSHTGSESLTALTVANVLNADVNALGNDAVADAFVDSDTDGPLVHVENATSLSVVELVRHAHLLRAISHNINVVSFLVNDHEFGEGVGTVSSI